MGRGQGSSKELGVCQVGTEAKRLEQEERRQQGKKQAEEFVTRPLVYLWTPLPSAQFLL